MLCLFVHQSAELYGSDRVLLALVETLRQQSRYEPVVLLPEEGPLLEEFRRLGIEVHVLPLVKISRAIFTPGGLLGLLWQIPRSVRGVSQALAGRKVAVVHTNTLAVLTGAFWARWHRIPHVWHVHEIINRPKIVAWGFPVLLKWFADRVVSISRMTQDNLLRRRPSLTSKSEIVWNGLQMPDMPSQAQREQFRHELGIGSEIVVSLVGRINQWKGQRLLVAAARIIAKSHGPDKVKFLIVGSPPKGQEHYLGELTQDIQAAGLSGQVVVKEFVKDIWPVWSATDIAVVPSTEPEPFGMVAIEAMALEKPVVAAGHGGLLDIIEDSKSGLFFKPGDAEQLALAIGQLLNSRDKREAMGQEARQRVQTTFSLGAQAHAFERIYDALVVEK